MRARKTLRPQVESLESMALLSGMGGMFDAHVPRQTIAPALTTAAPLSGTLHGVYVAHQSNSASNFTYHLNAGGSLAPIGGTGLNGSITLSGPIATGSGASTSAAITGMGTLFLHTRHGSLTLQVTTATTSAAPAGHLELTYTVTAATGSDAVEQGETGTIDASLRSFIPSFVHLSNVDVGRLTMTFTTPSAAGTTTVGTA